MSMMAAICVAAAATATIEPLEETPASASVQAPETKRAQVPSTSPSTRSGCRSGCSTQDSGELLLSLSPIEPRRLSPAASSGAALCIVGRELFGGPALWCYAIVLFQRVWLSRRIE